MAFKLAPVGGVISLVVLVPVWVNNELRFMIVPAYPLSMPLPPDVGTMRVSIYHNVIKLLKTVSTKHGKMAPIFSKHVLQQKGFDSGLIYNSTLFQSFLAQTLMVPMFKFVFSMSFIDKCL